MQSQRGSNADGLVLRAIDLQRADWEATPPWLQWLGRKPFRRSLYAWWNLDGAFDGWEYSDHPPLREQRPSAEQHLLRDRRSYQTRAIDHSFYLPATEASSRHASKFG